MLSHYGDCGLKRRIPTNGTLGTLGRWFPVTRCAPYTLKPGGDKALDGPEPIVMLRIIPPQVE